MTMMSDLGRIALPIGSPGQPTMQDLSEAIRRDPEVSATRKRDICSAIRTLCAAFGEAAADVPASHAYFRRRLKDFHPKQAGLGEKRFRNIRSEIGFVLRRYLGQSSLAGRRPALSPAWGALRHRLHTDGFRYGLSRFMQFCSTHRVEPDGVDDAVGRHFLACLRDETFIQRPEALHRRTLTLWNKAVNTIEGWPNVLLTLPSNHQGYCLPWDRLPDPLRQDAEAWLERLRNPDILGDDSPARPARPATVKARKFQVRQIVSALVRGGQDLDALTSLEALVHPQRVRRVLRFFLDRAGAGRPARPRPSPGRWSPSPGTGSGWTPGTWENCAPLKARSRRGRKDLRQRTARGCASSTATTTRRCFSGFPRLFSMSSNGKANPRGKTRC